VAKPSPYPCCPLPGGVNERVATYAEMLCWGGSRDRSDPGEINCPSARWSPGRYAATSTSILAGPPVWVKPGYQRQKQPARSLLGTAVRALDEELGSGR